MTSVQRAFAQKLSKQHAADVRKNISGHIPHKTISISCCSSLVSLTELAEPFDYEEFLSSQQHLIERDSLRNVLDFPLTDVEVCSVQRKIRTLRHVVPEENFENLLPRVQACIRCYTGDWSIVRYCYRKHSSSNGPRHCSRSKLLFTSPRQEFEIDFPYNLEFSDSTFKLDSELPSGRQSVASSISSSTTATDSTLTPRNSWASFDLRNSVSDPLLADVFDQTSPEQIDQENETKRKEDRQEALFQLYPLSDDFCIERRFTAEVPAEHQGHKFIVKCLQLKLDLEVEPLFAIMALYDAKEKKKLSENFYFDLNSEALKRMLGGHVPYSDLSTLSRTAIFDVTHPSSDLYIVVRLEKVLQGDINECAEPYMKDDKNRDKVKANAVATCERLGKYRQAFAWTAISFINVITGNNSLERDSVGDRDSINSVSTTNSLERKSSSSGLDSLRRRTTEVGGSLTRRGSLERKEKRSHSPDYLAAALDTFRPITITVSSFFKQESDKLRDEDLYKFLPELKRPSSAFKKLKCIPGMLKLDIAPCPDEVNYCLTSELEKVHPYPDEKSRPIKEILEFPLGGILVPHYTYRNLLFVSPKELNFSNRTGSARNIAVRVQLMAGEHPQSALPNIFGKSSCPEYTTEAYAAINYHNKCPVFYDEFKMKLPASICDSHHLLFTFYHISCQRKLEQTTVDTPVGYTWLPILKEGFLSTGEFCLPVMLDPPPPNYCYIPPDVNLPGTRWLDNHKGVFTVVVSSYSSIHTEDSNIERFLTTCDWLETNQIPARIGSEGAESELRANLQELGLARNEPLVKFLPIVLDYLLRLLVQPPYLQNYDQTINVSTAAFEALCKILNNVSDLQDLPIDQHGRHSLLTTYVQYQCNLPHPLAESSKSSTPSTPHARMIRSTSNPDLHLDSEVEIISRGIDRTASMRAGCVIDPGYTIQCRRIVHEELALQWVVSSGVAKDHAMGNSWILFDLIIKSMAEHLAHTHSMNAPRKMRFSDQFVDDISTLVHNVTSEIISRYSKDTRLSHSLNCSLAFFLFDLFSLMNRGFVLCLIRTYCKQMVAKISTLPDAMTLIDFKLDFLRIISSHEHFIPLNLPFATPYTASSAPASPNPSISSSVSQTSFLSGLTPHERANYAELSVEFRQQHFLIGLLLSDLTTVFEIQNQNLHAKAVDCIRNLLAWHDADPRYTSTECRARVAVLYLPLLAITMDALQLLYCSPDNRDKNDDYVGGINVSVAMAIAGTKNVPVNNYDIYQQNRKIFLNAEVTRHLLVCFLWVIKNIAEDVMTQWLSDLSPNRLQSLLQVLHVCISCFEYKGKKEIKRCTQQNFRKTTDIKSRLEDVILGQGSARSELIQRRKERTSAFGNGDKLRWRKDQMPYRSSVEQTERPHEELEASVHIEGNLATEVSLVVLDTLEHIVQVVQVSDSQNTTMCTVFKVLLHALARNQSTTVLQHMFATQRSLVFKFHSTLFDEENELCADLCLLLLRHCGSRMPTVRVQAAASLYLLMRQTFEIGNNFARVKMQVTMSLSSLVGTDTKFNEESLRRSLKTILEYAEQDQELQETTFPEQVRDLVFNLHMILSDTVKMKEFQEDPEMLIDLMYRIAKGYQNSPDLRLTWLANMAQKHMERNNHTEAGMCLIHSAALVSEYLAMQESLSHLPVGAVALECVTPNALCESAVSDDVLSPEHEGVCLGSHFTEAGLLGLLEHAASSFQTAGMYEAMNDVYKVLIPIAEHNRDFKKLANIHGKLHEAYTRIEQLHGKRVFGTYFRVGFYGTKFGDLDEKEFVYKEPTLTKLPEIFSRLENFYAERFGVDNIVIIKDSNTVDLSQLDPEKGYIQITYVEPYFEPYELRYRVTHFERNFNIKRFVYATPFTPGGRAHGELHEQCKRKTILTTAMHFPYVKTRIQVVDREQIVLSPIEVAIEDIQKKTTELATATIQEPPDPKILQMVLQGCIGTTVNQGPMEMAQVFLSGLEGKQLTKHQNKLRLCFKDFSKKCLDALKKNRNLIAADQRDYQKELDRNYHRFTERLQPLITINPDAVILTTPNGNRYQSFSSGSRPFKVNEQTSSRW